MCDKLRKESEMLEIENSQISLLNKKLIDKLESIENEIIMMKSKTLMNQELSLDY
jgi:hypothetical protein